LTLKAWKHDVQVMVEGPGHIPFDQVAMNVEKQQKICHGAPFYVLGPLVTDIGMGYDHITAAIGGAIAGAAGADFLCYVTPSEHIRLPTIEDVKEGVIVSKLAAHAADIAKGIKGAMEKDIQMAKCRKALDWNGQIALSLNPEKVKELDIDDINYDIYLNGVKSTIKNPLTLAQKVKIYSGVRRIGVESYKDVNTYFNGNIDEVMIFDKKLSDAEIASIYDYFETSVN